jgi:Uri superfamily endonuclease
MEYDTSSIPGEPGYYALFIRVGKQLAIKVKSGRVFRLKPGIYVYIGSARGPGGLRARIERHLRRNKKKHWHIDYLTTNPDVEVLTAVSLAYGEDTGVDVESGLSRHLAGRYEGIEGFGSTDKPTDKTHLFYCGETMKDYEECLGIIVDYMRNAALHGKHKYRLSL